ncbi:hypothetical protein [Mycobacterium sp. 23]|uniref:hypothetical protein n=1 Tax=Mycobacterium sp. 23 TaxID=3400424 RepID=UPI003AACB78D
MTSHIQEVGFGASAAVPLQRRKPTPLSSGPWLADTYRVVAAFIRRAFVTPEDAARPVRKSKPERYQYLERSLVAREMYRL